MTRCVVQVRLPEAEKRRWLVAAGPKGLSRYVRDAVNAALSERGAGGESFSAPAGALVKRPRSESAVVVPEPSRARVVGVCERSGLERQSCLCPSCKEARARG